MIGTVRTLTDYSGRTWRVEQEDLRDVGLRAGQTAIVFTNQGGSRRWTVGIPSTLPYLSIQELRQMLENAKTRKLLNRVAARAGWPAGGIRSRIFRNTYCSARLQTLDQGAPVSLYTVSREMGHSSEKMIQEIYGHLGQVRHRAEVMEFRVEQHRERLEGRLAHLNDNVAGTFMDGRHPLR